MDDLLTQADQAGHASKKRSLPEVSDHIAKVDRHPMPPGKISAECTYL